MKAYLVREGLVPGFDDILKTRRFLLVPIGMAGRVRLTRAAPTLFRDGRFLIQNAIIREPTCT
jgi:hypothetical protein